ncbi:type I restriction modification DNA specificity domain protein [Streptococcus anginosus F0211]|uniref:Type I restriction modification DNA specificity domain protein n=3 Tax=Streptococcus TaxID=1301 RepID=E6J2B3_STRAP|nr:type I restriction modification DNA specificity domain protein [Streptococcus anginosus F0211]
MVMATVKLGDIAIEAKSSNKGDKTGIRIVGLEHLTPSNVTLSSWSDDTENSFTKEFSKGDVLFGRRRAYLKKAAVAPFDGICSGDITVIRAIEDKVDPDLLPFIIQNDFLFDFAVGKSAGSLSPRVKWTHLKEFAIELPSMPEQSKLAETLWSINETKNAYEDLINKTDELVKSQFIEWFGNEKNTAELGECAFIEKGKIITRDNVVEGDVPVVAAGIEPSCYHNESNRMAGIITVSASGANAGYVNYWNMPIFASDCNTVLTKDTNKLDEVFLYHRLRTMQEEIFLMQRGSGQPHVYAKDLEHIIVPVPNMDAQIRFSAFAEQSDKSKFALQEAIKDLDALSKKIIAENLIPAGKE